MSLKKFSRFLFLATICFLGSGTWDTEKFSYCSNGRCYERTAQDFLRDKNFPLELNYTCKNNNHYALTFDDGPSQNIPELLEILARHEVVATFFVVGQNLLNDEGKSLLRSIADHGHDIANHTFSHRSLVTISDDEIRSELKSTQNAIKAALEGYDGIERASSIIRPPFGEIDQRVQNIVNELDFVSVRWNSDRYDWHQDVTSPMISERIAQHLKFLDTLPKSFNTSIIDLNHDGVRNSLEALDKTLPLIKSRGYQFVTVRTCLGL